jgi:hypothetical protein
MVPALPSIRNVDIPVDCAAAISAGHECLWVAHVRRCITMDDNGWAWVGSETGNVKAVELALQKQPHGGLCKTLKVRAAP